MNNEQKRARHERTGRWISALGLSSSLIVSCTVLERDFAPEAGALADLGDDRSALGGAPSNGRGDGDSGGSGGSDGNPATGGGPMCEAPTEEEVCGGLCGTLDACGQTLECGACEGEATCGGASEDNHCGCAEPPCALFNDSFGDAATQKINDMVVDGDGNVYLAGSFRGTLTIGDDSHTAQGSWDDAFVVKLDPQGAPLWSLALGDASSQEAVSVALDGAGNLIVGMNNSGTIDFGPTGESSMDIVIAKYSPDGELSFFYENESSISADLIAVSTDLATNDIYLTGNFWGNIKFGAMSTLSAAGTDAYYDVFVARLDPLGVPKSSKRFGDGSDQVPSDMSGASSGVYVAVEFNGSFDFGPPNAVTLSTDEWYSLGLAKLSGTLYHSWSRQFGGEVWGTRLATDGAGGVVIGGNFVGELTFDESPLSAESGQGFLAHLDGEGVTRWAHQLPGVKLQAVAIGPNDSVTMTGFVDAEADFGDGPIAYSGSLDVVMARFSQSGKLVWARVFPAAVGSQTGAALAVDDEGNSWVAANFTGQFNFGITDLQTQGGDDIAVGKFGR